MGPDKDMTFDEMVQRLENEEPLPFPWPDAPVDIETQCVSQGETELAGARMGIRSGSYRVLCANLIRQYQEIQRMPGSMSLKWTMTHMSGTLHGTFPIPIPRTPTLVMLVEPIPPKPEQESLAAMQRTLGGVIYIAFILAVLLGLSLGGAL